MRIILNGAAGRMGCEVIRLVASAGAGLGAALERPGHPLLGKDAGKVAGAEPMGVPITADPGAALGGGGVVLDFSTLEGTERLLDALEAVPRPAVVAVTGLGSGLRERWITLSGRAPVILASNLSVGAAVIRLLGARAARALPDFDLEVAEIHHSAKADAPSGTALDIADALAHARGLERDGTAVHGRRPGDGRRRPGSIGIHAIRGGTVTGEHEILLLGRNERLAIRHSAESREIFASGALRAAAWLESRPAGLYGIDDVVADALGP